MLGEKDTEQKSTPRKKKKSRRNKRTPSGPASESSSRTSTSKSKSDEKSTPPEPLLAPTNPEAQVSVGTSRSPSIGIPRSPTGTLTPKDNQVASQSPCPVDHGNVDAPGAPLTPVEGGLSIDSSTRDGTPSDAAPDLIVANAQPSVLDAPAKLGESVKELAVTEPGRIPPDHADETTLGTVQDAPKDLPASTTHGTADRRHSPGRVSISSVHFPIGSTGASRLPSPGMSLKASPSRVSTRKAAVTGGTTAQKSEEKFQTKATTRRSGMTSRFKRLRRPRLSIRGVSLGDLENLMRKSPRRPSGSKEALSRKFVITVIVCAAITFVTLAVLVSLLKSTGKPPDTQRAICKTEGCVSHAMLLTFHLNRSIDPCDDFSAYVCSAWKRDSQRYELGESVLVSSVYSWIKNYGAMLRTGAYKLPAGRKPLFMYDTCMADESAYGRSVEKFHEVMQEIGLSWPEDSPPESDAFGVLINLAFNWEEVSWFRATVSKGTIPGKERLVIVPARMLRVNFNQHRQVRVTGTYYDYWKSFYESFNLNGTPPIADKHTVRDLEQIESDVLENLLKAVNTQAKELMSFPLRNVTKYTRNISSDVWLAGINKYAPEGHEFTADDEVVVNGEAFILAVGDLLSTYSDQQLLRYFSWQFVQLFGPVTDQRLFVTRYVLPERARIYRQVFCSYITEAPYEQLTSALTYAASFSDEDRKLVDAGFNNLITAAIKEIVSSHSLSEDSKKLIAQKLNSLALDLWPPDRYLIDSELEWLYMNFTTHESTFVDYWASTRRSLLEAKRILGFSYKANGGRNFLPPYLSYDPVTNSVSIAFSILSRPMYYKDGTKGMFYGGVGYLLALEIVKSFSTYIRQRSEDDVAKMRDAVSQVYGTQKACMKHRKIFPEIPALEIAYTALSEALANASQRLDVRKDLSEEKIVFMTLCYVSCMQVDVLNSPIMDCNVAVKNFPPFAKAFNCTKGSAMNPHEQCMFFQ